MATPQVKKKQMTRRESELLNLVVKFIDSQGFPPSLRELSDIVEANSTNYIRILLAKLEEKGYVKRRKNRARSLQVTEAGVKASRPVGRSLHKRLLATATA